MWGRGTSSKKDIMDDSIVSIHRQSDTASAFAEIVFSAVVVWFGFSVICRIVPINSCTVVVPTREGARGSESHSKTATTHRGFLSCCGKS
jgi:hypothetical protein